MVCPEKNSLSKENIIKQIYNVLLGSCRLHVLLLHHIYLHSEKIILYTAVKYTLLKICHYFLTESKQPLLQTGAEGDINLCTGYETCFITSTHISWSFDILDCMRGNNAFRLSCSATNLNFSFLLTVPTDPPLGLISQMSAISEYMAFILFPVEDGIEELDLREVHQIVRELTRGIFVLNQLPTISLEANFDQSTSCQIPPAYLDTRVGQLLIDVDYMLKCLWHGCSFTKEKRIKFSDRWRGNLQVNANGKPETKKVLITEFTSAGKYSNTTCMSIINILYLV